MVNLGLHKYLYAKPDYLECMEYRTVATKLSSNELSQFRMHCEKKGVTPSLLIKELILMEMKITVPHIVAGKNVIRYNKNHDSFTWSLELDSGRTVEVLENVAPVFLEDLLHTITTSVDERYAFIQKTKRDSVPVPSEMLRGKNNEST